MRTTWPAQVTARPSASLSRNFSFIKDFQGVFNYSRGHKSRKTKRNISKSTWHSYQPPPGVPGFPVLVNRNAAYSSWVQLMSSLWTFSGSPRKKKNANVKDYLISSSSFMFVVCACSVLVWCTHPCEFMFRIVPASFCQHDATFNNLLFAHVPSWSSAPMLVNSCPRLFRHRFVNMMPPSTTCCFRILKRQIHHPSMKPARILG